MVVLPSGKRSHNYGKSPFLMRKSTISMAIFNSKLLVYQRVTGKSTITGGLNGKITDKRWISSQPYFFTRWYPERIIVDVPFYISINIPILFQIRSPCFTHVFIRIMYPRNIPKNIPIISQISI